MGLAKEQVDQFIALYNAGERYEVIAERVGMHKLSINRKAAALGLPPRVKVLSDEEKVFIAEQFQRNVPVENIATFLGRSPSSIYNELDRQKIKRNTVSGPTAKIDKRSFNKLLSDKKKKNLVKFRDTANNADPMLWATDYVPTINGIRLTRGALINIVNEGERQNIVNDIFLFYRAKGFPHLQFSTDELIKKFYSLQQSEISPLEEIINIFLREGINIVKHFSPHFYETTSGISDKPSVVSAFNDDETLKRVIYKSCFGWKARVINGNELRNAFKVSNEAFQTSTFLPSLARAIYSNFCKEGDIVYDFSMGFGHRLLGALSLPFNVKYIGVDPYTKSFQSNCDIYDFYKKTLPELSHKDFTMTMIGSEDYRSEEYKGKIDFAFSSPPYFNTETYSTEETQAAFGGYDQFINNYWRKTVNNLKYLIKDQGILALNIKNNVREYALGNSMLAVLKNEGFELIRTYQISLKKENDFYHNPKGSPKLEPIYIFRNTST